MSIRFRVAALSFLLALAMQFYMIKLFRRMIGEVNRRLSKEIQVPEWGISLWRGRVVKWHREMYPKSTLRRRMYCVWLFEMVAFLLAVGLVAQFT